MAKEPSAQEFTDRELWRYPVRIAELLLGTSDPQRVIDSVVEFAKTYDDTEDQIENVPGIVNTVWAGCSGRDPGPFRREFTIQLCGLAFESGGASEDWYQAHGYIPAQAVFLWTAALCCGTVHSDWVGGTGSVTALSRWVLHGVSSSESLTVAERMCETLFAFVVSWDEIELLWLLACIRMAVGDENPIVEPFDAKLATQEDYVGAMRAIDPYWNVDRRQLASWGKKLCRYRRIGHPSEDTEAIRRKYSEAATLFQEMLARIVDRCTGESQE